MTTVKYTKAEVLGYFATYTACMVSSAERREVCSARLHMGGNAISVIRYDMVNASKFEQCTITEICLCLVGVSLRRLFATVVKCALGLLQVYRCRH